MCQNVVKPMVSDDFEGNFFVEIPLFGIFGAPDPDVGPDFLQRPSLRHLASEHNAYQK